MRTLYHIQTVDPVWDATVIAKEIMDAVLLQSIQAASNGTLSLNKSKKPKAMIKVQYKGHEWSEDVLKHAVRILNLLNRAPIPQPITEEDSEQDILNWFISAAPQLLAIRRMPMGESLCHTMAQVAEKGFRKELREIFNIGVIDGEVAEGTMYETIQAQIYQQAGGPGKITRGNHLHIRNDGELAKYSKSTRNQGGKQGDLLIETDYLTIFTTNKAQTATKDGGGRTSEYEQDLGGTLYKRAARFRSKGYEIRDNRLVLVFGMIDSRFFANNPHAVKLIQSRAGEDITDTFLSDSDTMAKFVATINCAEVIKNPGKLIKAAFDQLSVSV